MNPYLVLGALLAVAATLGGAYLAGSRHASASCNAAWQANEIKNTQAWRAQLAEKEALANTLQIELAQAHAAVRTVYKEVVHEIPATTTGRLCLGADTLGLLDRLAAGATGLRLPAPADEPVGAARAVASDTEVARWAADAIEQHERERARCNALIKWHDAGFTNNKANNKEKE